MFLFDAFKKINTDLLRLSQITYGGEFYYGLRKYRHKELNLLGSNFLKVQDSLLKKIGNTSFYSYKNIDTGFVANLFENIKNKSLVIAYRGTERIGMGENHSDIQALIKDIKADIDLVSGVLDEQFYDAYEFYNIVKEQYPNRKITIVGQSLGGALAQLVGAKIFSETNKKIKTFTYNAPGCKHLLESFGCNLSLNYSFITNYAVMNDWCGMFGEKVGEMYLLPPIPPCTITTNSIPEILQNILLVSHEGIFEYSGRVYKKPNDFNQSEGLALWIFDKNNPMKDFESPSEFVASIMQTNNMPKLDSIGDFIQNKLEEIPNEKFQEISSYIQTATAEFVATQKNKIMEVINNNTLNQVTQFLDMTLSQITPETLKTALRVMKKLNIHKTQPEYYNSFLDYIK